MNQLQFLRALVILNGLIPLVMLSWDAYRGQLGANSVNNALHITGILSLVFLFLSLLMSPLRWMTGWGGWVAFRRALGLYGFFYAVVHLVIYVGFDRALSLTSTLNEIWMRRFLQIGAVAILLMVPLAVTSTNGMIQRMGPKRWKLLHRLTYAVVVLGVLHYYMLVKSDVRQPLAFAGVLTVLLGSRFGRHYSELLQASKKKPVALAATNVSKAAQPPVPGAAQPATPISTRSAKPSKAWKGELRIAAIFQETPDVRTIRLMSTDGGEFPFVYQPGQFLNIQLMIDGNRVNRSYTLASSPTRADACELSIKREPMGLASRFIHENFKVGDVLKVSGPSGKFIFTGDNASGVVLIAGGVGITPVMSILRYLTDRAWTGNIHFLIVAKTEQDLIFRDELRWLQSRYPNLHVCITLTRPDSNTMWTGDRGRATGELFTRFVPDLTQLPVYLCGPNEMMDATTELLISLGVPSAKIHTEAFAGKKSATAGGGNGETDTTPTASSAPAVSRATPQAMAMKLATGGTATIRFSRSGSSTQVDAETTILEAAESVSIEIPYECRSGICGQCKTRLLEGTVQMDCEDALSATEKANGVILACQARPQSHVEVDA
jgi:ferredoxin-NADP reductase/DMSO/TMAO reductase YedYZ heme-binding membrane subunit